MQAILKVISNEINIMSAFFPHNEEIFQPSAAGIPLPLRGSITVEECQNLNPDVRLALFNDSSAAAILLKEKHLSLKDLLELDARTCRVLLENVYLVVEFMNNMKMSLKDLLELDPKFRILFFDNVHAIERLMKEKAVSLVAISPLNKEELNTLFTASNSEEGIAILNSLAKKIVGKVPPEYKEKKNKARERFKIFDVAKRTPDPISRNLSNGTIRETIKTTKRRNSIS